MEFYLKRSRQNTETKLVLSELFALFGDHNGVRFEADFPVCPRRRQKTRQSHGKWHRGKSPNRLQVPQVTGVCDSWFIIKSLVFVIICLHVNSFWLWHLSLTEPRRRFWLAVKAWLTPPEVWLAWLTPPEVWLAWLTPPEAYPSPLKMTPQRHTKWSVQFSP